MRIQRYKVTLEFEVLDRPGQDPSTWDWKTILDLQSGSDPRVVKWEAK